MNLLQFADIIDAQKGTGCTLFYVGMELRLIHNRSTGIVTM
jgi:hypothetical protein